jgi:hypothetical protein
MSEIMSTTDEACAMYARACCAWYGHRAAHVATEKAQQLRKRGDLSGVDAWTKVAAEIIRLQTRRDRSRRGRITGAKLY